MALLYRAMWSDDGPDAVQRAFHDFREWVDRKSAGRLAVPDQGTALGEIGADVRVDRSSSGGTAGLDDVLEAALVETRGDGSRWTTTLRAWSGPACSEHDGAEARYWVDVESETHDAYRNLSVRAPVLVRTMLANGQRPRRHGLPLSDRATLVEGVDDAEALAELVTSYERDLPLVVFAADPGDPQHQQGEDDPPARTARAVAGMAAVHIVAGRAIDVLDEALTTRYAVRDGAMRIYLTHLDPARDEDWRHRYVLPERFAQAPDVAVRMVVGQAAPMAVSRRADDSHGLARAELRRFAVSGRDEEAELMRDILTEENERLIGTVQEVREQVGEAQAAYEDLLEDHEDLRAEHSELQSRLERALSVLSRLGHAGSDAPERATHPSQAVALAREYLTDHLVIHPDADVRLDLLDGAREAGPWGQTTWEALRALHAYGAALGSGPQRYNGSFWTWCQTSGDPRVWRATSKKLAMTESESVQANSKLRAARRLPVAPEVHPDGRIEMFAHIKIAEGGGDLIPRIYFHVDAEGARVHVGFVGPHKHMRNLQK